MGGRRNGVTKGAPLTTRSERPRPGAAAVAAGAGTARFHGGSAAGRLVRFSAITQRFFALLQLPRHDDERYVFMFLAIAAIASLLAAARLLVISES